MDPLSILAAALDPATLGVVFVCTLYGAFVGAMPGLTATMAVALLVPFTYFMSPVAAVSAIVATTTTAIFAGDISGALLRIPGTPASAAYVDDAHAIAKAGQPRTVLLVSLFASVAGGIIGVAILSLAAPQLARFAAGFSSFETFWLATLGLTCALFVGGSSTLRTMASLFVGLAVATVGIDVAVGHPRFTFGQVELLDGIGFIPAMIGMFAVAELMRDVERGPRAPVGRFVVEPLGQATRDALAALRRRWLSVAGSGPLGAAVGALPGAGADIAAWIAYAVARRTSREGGFGRGAMGGIVAGGAANNAAVAGAWTPALVFGIPGDSVTAIAIGVLMMKGLTPGPQIFTEQGALVAALFGAFFAANLLMLVAGVLAILAATWLLRAPRPVLMPLVLVLSLTGAFAINASPAALWMALGLGLVGWLMARADIPIAPAILGIVLGRVVEDTFMVNMLKARGAFAPFFERDVSFVLGLATLGLWAILLLRAGAELVRPARPLTETPHGEPQ